MVLRDRSFARGAVLGIAVGAWVAGVTIAARASAEPVSDGPVRPAGPRCQPEPLFAQVPGAAGYSREHLLGHTTLDDAALIKRLGFRHVRLSVDPLSMVNPIPSGSRASIWPSSIARSGCSSRKTSR